MPIGGAWEGHGIDERVAGGIPRAVWNAEARQNVPKRRGGVFPIWNRMQVVISGSTSNPDWFVIPSGVRSRTRPNAVEGSAVRLRGKDRHGSQLAANCYFNIPSITS